MLAASACGTASSPAQDSAGSAKTMTEYVAGRWVPFSAPGELDQAQWAVVDAYANFTTAALAVYSTRSVAPLVTVISPQSKVTAKFTRDLASGKNPDSLSTKATVRAVAIHGCRASLTLDLYYPGGRSLHYVSSWVRPFDRAASATPKPARPGPPSVTSRSLTALETPQYAPWQFVGDNRVGGVDTPCGI
jgi:hypothetical protein